MSEWVQETLCIQITYEILKVNKPAADSDLQIRGGGGSSRPWDKGRGGLKKHFFRPFGPHFDLKIRGARDPRDPPLNPPLQTAGLTSHEKNRKTRKRLVIFKFTFQFSNVESVYSLLSFNRHLYKTDTSVKRTLRVAFLYSLYLTLCKTDISLRRTHNTGPQGVRLRKSWLYYVCEVSRNLNSFVGRFVKCNRGCKINP